MKEQNCGYVAIIGKPNVGKSTLLNCLVGEKVSITANKPQTTRHTILGIKTIDNKQAVYIDTPGMHLKHKKLLNKELNKAASSALSGVDAVIFVVSGISWTPEDQMVVDKVNLLDCPKILIINKVDTIKPKEKILEHILFLQEKGSFTEIIPCSALKKTQIDTIQNIILDLLPVGPFCYPEYQTTDKPKEFHLAEIIREKLTYALQEELPYAVSVEIEKIIPSSEQQDIYATIWVEKESQKAIVIGRQGQLLKHIGTQARKEMNNYLKERVHLELWVKVRDRAV